MTSTMITLATLTAFTLAFALSVSQTAANPISVANSIPKVVQQDRMDCGIDDYLTSQNVTLDCYFSLPRRTDSFFGKAQSIPCFGLYDSLYELCRNQNLKNLTLPPERIDTFCDSASAAIRNSYNFQHKNAVVQEWQSQVKNAFTSKSDCTDYCVHGTEVNPRCRIMVHALNQLKALAPSSKPANQPKVAKATPFPLENVVNDFLDSVIPKSHPEVVPKVASHVNDHSTPTDTKANGGIPSVVSGKPSSTSQFAHESGQRKSVSKDPEPESNKLNSESRQQKPESGKPYVPLEGKEDQGVGPAPIVIVGEEARNSPSADKTKVEDPNVQQPPNPDPKTPEDDQRLDNIPLEMDDDQNEPQFKDPPQTDPPADPLPEQNEPILDEDAAKQQPLPEDMPYLSLNKDDSEETNMVTYFVLMTGGALLFYVAFHNKNKLLALALEGRRTGRRGGRHSSAAYSKLNSNLEETIASGPTTPSATVLY